MKCLLICKTCGEEKPEEAFFANREHKTGRATSRCKDCWRAYKAYRAETRTSIPLESWCGSCKNSLPSSEFSLDKNSANGLYNRCKPCSRDERSKRKDKAAAYHRLKTYGLTEEMFDEMLSNQNHRCAVDESYVHNPEEKMGGLAVDHCHTCDEVRGLLCHTINKVIGLIGENPELLRRAADYIEFHQCGEERQDNE